MKQRLSIILFFIALAVPGIAGETGVTYTYQVLDGLVAGGARIEKVYCVDLYAHSGIPTAFQLIAAPNIPPTNAARRVEDVNVASASGVVISIATDSNPLQIRINANHVKVPPRFGLAAEDLLAGLLEAIRETALLTKVSDYQVTIHANGELDTYARYLLETFQRHPKNKPFWFGGLAQERKAEGQLGGN